MFVHINKMKRYGNKKFLGSLTRDNADEKRKENKRRTTNDYILLIPVNINEWNRLTKYRTDDKTHLSFDTPIPLNVSQRHKVRQALRHRSSWNYKSSGRPLTVIDGLGVAYLSTRICQTERSGSALFTMPLGYLLRTLNGEEEPSKYPWTFHNIYTQHRVTIGERKESASWSRNRDGESRWRSRWRWSKIKEQKRTEIVREGDPRATAWKIVASMLDRERAES